MTCYNREKYIATAIESVLASTYTNFELIICDDRSEDNTVEIIKKYVSTDSRIKYYQNETNLGDYPNRNIAAGYAKGKYIKYVDSDDYIYPWGIEVLLNQMEANPDAGYGLCSLEADDERPYPFLLNPEQAYTYNYLCKGIFQKAPLSAIIRRDVFENEKGFLPQRMSSDCEMWHRLSLKYDVLLMGDGIVWSRTHAGQEMSDVSEFIDSYEKIYIKYLTHKQCPLPKEKLKKIWSVIRSRYYKAVMKNLLLLRFAAVSDNIKRWNIYRNAGVWKSA